MVRSGSGLVKMKKALLVVLALVVAPLPVGAADHASAATKAGGNVLSTIDLIEKKLTATKYQHLTVVKLGKGIFYWDCSGMVEWVLRKAAPKARAALAPSHPLAKQFHSVIEASPTDGSKKGWTRLEGPDDIRPGDLFAWLKPDFWKKRKNTGHVGFVLEEPVPHPQHPGVWLVRVADSSRYLHEDDSRQPDGVGGFGTGTMAFLFDGQGSPVAYGWYGEPQPPETFVPTRIVFGRVTK